METLKNFIRRIVTYIFLINHGVETKFGYVNLVGFPLIKKCPGSRIIIGENVTLVSKTKGNILGINHPVILATLTQDAYIDLKKGCGASGSTIIAAKGITIGEYSGLGANTNIYDTDFHPIDPIRRRNQTSILDSKCKPIFIGDDVWIAANAVILKGVQLGNGSVVSYGSVVKQSFGEETIIEGNPAISTKEI